MFTLVPSFKSEADALLAIAISQFGPRHGTETFIGVMSHFDGPEIAYPMMREPGKFAVVIHISESAEADTDRRLYQIGHEVVHLLASMHNPPTIMLEEGAAVWFSIEAPDYKRENYSNIARHHLLNSWSSRNYLDALNLYEEVIKIYPNAIRDIRAIEPDLHKVTQLNIKDALPGISAELAARCTERRIMR